MHKEGRVHWARDVRVAGFRKVAGHVVLEAEQSFGVQGKCKPLDLTGPDSKSKTASPRFELVDPVEPAYRPFPCSEVLAPGPNFHLFARGFVTPADTWTQGRTKHFPMKS